MADGVGAGVKATKSFVMNHWLAFAIVALVLVALALSYDHKNNGKLTGMIAKIPVLGSLFTAFAFFLAFHGAGPAVHLLKAFS